jgi:(2Fe-2S) ferredoxin
MLMIRRPGGDSDGDRRQVFFADSRVGQTRLLTTTVPAESALADLELPTGGVEDAGVWTQARARLLCVCTHGKHDTCCAILGRPLAAALQAAAPEETWECSHVGGDRFAPNLVVLPEGLYFGRVDPDTAKEFVAGLVGGRIPLEAFRGRSSLSGPAQAASYFAAVEHQDDRIDAFTVASSQESSEAVPGAPAWTVRLAADSGHVDVTVQRRMSTEPYLLTCHSERPQAYPVYELVELAAVKADSGVT